MRVRRHFTGSPWEPKVGYCRAVRAGNLVFVAGTAPVAPGGGIAAPGDPYGQARRCFEIVTEALAAVGATPGDVVRTRMFVTDASRWAEFGRAHAEAFGAAPPAATMVEVKGLVDPAMLIEVEVDAVVGAAPRAGKRVRKTESRRAAGTARRHRSTRRPPG